VQFFVDWLDALKARDRRDGRLNAERESELAEAREYWEELADRANAQ
jgi:hypothetical protein